MHGNVLRKADKLSATKFKHSHCSVLVFQLEVCYNKVDRLLIGLTAQQKGTTALWYGIQIKHH